VPQIFRLVIVLLSQAKRDATFFPTKTWPGQAKRDATLQIIRPKHRQAKPNEGRARDSSNVRFSGPTGGKSAQHRGSQPEENQRIGQKPANPGLIGQDEKKTSRDGGGSDLGELYQAGPGTPGCKGTPEP
jgi:hypothetical protein